MRQHSNLEFRKVPSLKYLYEIDKSGRHVRNVKSKKYVKTWLDVTTRTYVCFINQRKYEIKDMVHECWHKRQPAAIRIDGRIFDTLRQASEYVALNTGRTPEQIRSKLKKRRKHILGFNVAYLNAETGHAGSTEQGTVQG